MNTAACLCGELRVLESVHMQNVLYNSFQIIRPDYFFIISAYWTSMKRVVNDSSIEKIKHSFSPIVFKEGNANTSISHRFEECFSNIVTHEVKKRRMYDWIIKTRPDVYFHCNLLPFTNFHIFAGWDYFVASPRIYAPYLFSDTGCRYHNAICNICNVKRIFNNITFVPVFQIVDIARYCQLHKQELLKRKCFGAPYSYASIKNVTCKPFISGENQVLPKLWHSLTSCIINNNNK